MSNEIDKTASDESYDAVDQLLASDNPPADIDGEIEGDIDDVHTVAGGEKEHFDDDDLPQDGEAVEESDQTEDDQLVDYSKIRDKLKFMQTSYQKQTELLKKSNPALYEKIQAQLKAERGVESNINTVDDDNDDPYMKAIQNGFKSLEQKQHMQINAEKYAQEYSLAETALTNFVTENNISREDINAALEEAAEMGFDMNDANKNMKIGVPSKAAKYIMEKLQHKMLQEYLQGKKASVEADFVNKSEQMKKVAQPKGGATPEPKAKSREQKLLERMQNAGNKQEALNQIFNS